MSACFRLAAQHAVVNLVRGYGLVLSLRHPAITPTQHAHETRVAFINDLAAHLHRILIARHTPPQIHVHQMDAIFHQFLAQLGEHESHQMIPFRLHVAEGAANKDANGFPGGRHGGCQRVSSSRGGSGGSGGLLRMPSFWAILKPCRHSAKVRTIFCTRGSSCSGM